MAIPRAPATQIVFNSKGQHHHQTISFIFFLGDAVTGTLTLSADIDGWIRVGVDGLQAPHTGAVRSTVGACLLDLETGVVKSEEGTALLYGCTT